MGKVSLLVLNHQPRKETPFPRTQALRVTGRGASLKGCPPPFPGPTNRLSAFMSPNNFTIHLWLDAGNSHLYPALRRDCSAVHFLSRPSKSKRMAAFIRPPSLRWNDAGDALYIPLHKSARPETSFPTPVSKSQGKRRN